MQAFTPRMGGDGRVIMIGSDFAWRTAAGMSAYSAAKAAQHSLVRSWAAELGPRNITVNAVAPGWIPVERHANASPAERAAYVEQVPLGRFGSPADVAAAVVYLAGPDAGFVTGEIITVNGGHTPRT
jgi:NAD(P)-dependent dehydrogenase (short-subunit alcohol dehydrogenase family)